MQIVKSSKLDLLEDDISTFLKANGHSPIEDDPAECIKLADVSNRHMFRCGRVLLITSLPLQLQVLVGRALETTRDSTGHAEALERSLRRVIKYQSRWAEFALFLASSKD